MRSAKLMLTWFLSTHIHSHVCMVAEIYWSNGSFPMHLGHDSLLWVFWNLNTSRCSSRELHDLVTGVDGPAPANDALGEESLNESNAEALLADWSAELVLHASNDHGSETWPEDVNDENDNSKSWVVKLVDTLIPAGVTVAHLKYF